MNSYGHIRYQNGETYSISFIRDGSWELYEKPEEKFEITLNEIEAILKSSWEEATKKYRLKE